MPIHHDPEKRWWIEIGGANPSLVDSFRPALVAFLAFDSDRVPRLTGTGFVLASTSDFASVVSAKHVFTEGVLRVQRPRLPHASSAIFVSKQNTTPSIIPERLKVVWMGNKKAAMLNADHVCYNDTLDIASCIVMPQSGETIPEHISIPLDIDVPTLDQVVHMVSIDDMDATESIPPRDRDGKGQIFSLYRRISVRIGVVTGVYPQGFRQYRWPCFTTSIPAKPGMSGGFVYWPRERAMIAACGVVCADNSTDEAHRDFFQCGESVVASTWPALSLQVPHAVPSYPGAPVCTLFEMIRRGFFPQPLGGIERIKLSEISSGEYRIEKDT